MVKIWCEECYGTGKQQWQQSSQNIPYDEPCESCDGKGYTEADVVEVEKVQTFLENGWIVELCDWLDSLKEAK